MGHQVPRLQLMNYSMCLQLTVVHLVSHNVDLEATVTQQRVRWHSTAVANIWFQRGG